MCRHKCRLGASISNNKQRWNDDRCRCECIELIDKRVCNKGSTWNPSNCEYECDKSCDIGDYLDYENWKCRRKLVNKLVTECTENIDEVKIAKITSNENACICSYTFRAILAVIALAISIGIVGYFAYSRWYLKKDVTCIKFGTRTQWNCAQTTI